MQTAAELRDRLTGRLPLAYGVSGPLAAPLFLPAEVTRLVRVALEADITIFDTAPSYGAGEAERRLGAALRGRDDVVVMTKAGVEARGVMKRQRDFRPGSIVRSVEASLARLARERIDVLWLHGPAPGELTDELLIALERLATDGKVLGVGVATRDLGVAALAAKGPFSALMAPSHQHSFQLPEYRGDLTVFGIECLINVARPQGAQFSRSSLWKSLRSLAQNAVPGASMAMEPPGTAPLAAQDAFRQAFEGARCDVVVATSTKGGRIRQNSEICRSRMTV